MSHHDDKVPGHRGLGDKIKGKAEELGSKAQKQMGKVNEDLKNKARDVKDAAQAKAGEVERKFKHEHER